MFCFTAYDLKAICLQCVVYFLFDRIYSLVNKNNHGAIFFLINELFETLFNIVVIVASMQASIYNTIILEWT